MKRYFAAIISAVAAAALCLAGALVPGLTAAAQAAELSVENKVYRRIEGVNARGPNLAVLSTQSLELTVSIDVPSGRFAYLGFNNSDRGAGAPAAGATAGIGLLVYNSNNTCMAFEVYRNDNWAQLTETLEIGSIRPSDTVTVSIRNVNGARGVYIDGELLMGKAKGQGGTTAGDTINPLDYIAESDYSANGKTYVEWGLWDGGGQAAVYAQTVMGSLGVLDRDGEKIRGYGIEAAFDEYGNEIPLIGSALDGDTFTLSSLTGNLIRTLKVTTAGGVSAKAKIGSGNTIEGTDYRVRVTGGGAPLDKVSFTIRRDGRDITEYVKVTSDGGLYAIEDCAAELEVTASRAGFAEKTLVIPAGTDEAVEIALEEKPIALSVALVNEATGKPVSGMADRLKTYKGDDEVSASIFESSTGVYGISGFFGKMGAHELRFEGVASYREARLSLDENCDGKPLKLYTSTAFTATVVTEAGAEVKAGGKTFTAAGTAYQLKNVVGELAVEISKPGKATRYAWLNGKNKTVQVALSDEFECALSLPVPDGTVVCWTIDGVAKGSGTVKGGRVSVPHVGTGSTLTLSVEGAILKKDVYTLTGDSLSPELENANSTEVRVLYNGAPVADTAVDFGFGVFTTDAQGKLELLSYGATTFKLVSVEGFSAADRSEIGSDEREVTINVTGKLFRARIAVKNADGSSVTDALVTLRADGETKKTYLNGETYEASRLTKAYAVLVNGVEAGRVDEENPELTYVLAEPAAPELSGGCNSVVGAGTGILAAVGAVILCGKKRRGNERKN